MSALAAAGHGQQSTSRKQPICELQCGPGGQPAGPEGYDNPTQAEIDRANEAQAIDPAHGQLGPGTNDLGATLDTGQSETESNSGLQPGDYGYWTQYAQENGYPTNFRASDGTVINGYTKHGIESALGDITGAGRSDPAQVISPATLYDSVVYGDAEVDTSDPRGPVSNYTLAGGARVSVNQSGDIIGVRPAGSNP